MNYLDFFATLLPETTLVLTALAVLLVDAAGLRELKTANRILGASLVSLLGCALSVAFVCIGHGSSYLLDGILINDPLTRLIKVAILIPGMFTCLLTPGSRLRAHPGEYFCILLLAMTGLLLLVSSENLLVIFLSLELASMCLYILAAFNTTDARSIEAGLKYFLFGGISAAFTLFGFSLIYGLTGSIDLRPIAGALGQSTDPLLMVAVVMVIAGFGFKIAAVPFHLWAPDVYEAAPLSSAAFIASGSKVASFYVLARVVFTGMGGTTGVPGSQWMTLLAILAASSMVLGNLAALTQTSVRRLLAFSAVANAGYMLIGVLAPGSGGLPALAYYLILYSITAIGAFGVVALVEARSGHDRLGAFSGLCRNSPVTAFCLMVFLLSLAGIPPLGGFFAKFYLFAAALRASPGDPLILSLVVLAIASSAVSLYYYLRVLKEVYVRPVAGAEPAPIPDLPVIGLFILAIAVILLGSFPQWLVHAVESAQAASSF